MSLELIQTRAGKVKLNDDFSATVFVARKKKVKPIVKPNLNANIKNEKDLNKNQKKDVDELDMNKMRHEIIKFGMTGLDELEKQNTKVALAVKLGARPPKRKYINYKELQMEQKAKKLAEADGIQNASGADKPPGKFSMKQLRHATPKQLYGQILKNYGVVEPNTDVSTTTSKRVSRKFTAPKRGNTNHKKGPPPKRKK